MSGLDEDWKEDMTITSIFECMLPFLLKNPNTQDSLNEEAGSLYDKDKDRFRRRARKFLGQTNEAGSSKL